MKLLPFVDWGGGRLEDTLHFIGNGHDSETKAFLVHKKTSMRNEKKVDYFLQKAGVLVEKKYYFPVMCKIITMVYIRFLDFKVSPFYCCK